MASSSSPRFRPALIVLASIGLLITWAAIDYAPRVDGYRYSPNEVIVLGLLASLVAAPVLFLVRIGARAYLRASGHDVFGRIRRWAAARPRATRAILAAPTVLSLAASSDAVASLLVRSSWAPALTAGAVAWMLGLWIVPSIGAGLVGMGLLQGFLAPLAADARDAAAEELTFSAVAVTPEARAAVVAAVVLSAVVAGLVAYLPQQIVYAAPGLAGLFGYIALVAGGAAAFQRVSRIAVGFDGVLVSGSSRTRFYPYRDLEGVEATQWGDVLLRRHGRTVLRLQLHGEDEGRHETIAARIREGILRARDLASGGAQRLAEAVGSAQLGHAARGQGSFRAPGATRDELWELVESAATPGAARSAAAEALAEGADRADRARLRVAADRCAEPRARAALLRIAVEEDPEEEEAGEVAPVRVQRKS